MGFLNKTYSLLLLWTALWHFGLVAQTQKINIEKSTIHWIGKKITGEHEGFIKLINGELKENNGIIESGIFEVDMTSITCTDLKNKSYNQKLIEHLKSDDFFSTQKYPTATLKITKPAALNNEEAQIEGNLTIKDKQAPLVFMLSKSKIGYNAKLEIDRSKYDIKYGSSTFFDNLGDKVIEDVFVLNVTLAF